MIVEWNYEEVIKAAEKGVELATRESAEAVANDAKTILMSNAKHPTGHLASEIDVRASKYKNGGHLVYAQGPGNWTAPYHAIFVELGTHKMQAIPYLRPALKRNKELIMNSFENKME